MSTRYSRYIGDRENLNYYLAFVTMFTIGLRYNVGDVDLKSI